VFFASPGRWQKVSCHDEIVETAPVPVDGYEVLCHDETVEMTSKKQGTSASAGSPIDFVSAAGSVWMPLDLISWFDVTRIDFIMHYGFVRVAEAN